MPKLKSNRAAKKRFKVTASGKVKRWKAYGSHLLTKKTRKRKRNLRKATLVDETEVKRIKRLILAK
ncbi:MAG TPA: 50S ribosomal protein L35 [Bacteroidetes bacterium]|nr:50S ribosomal protein L35 [Bacteroidota bacterium]